MWSIWSRSTGSPNPQELHPSAGNLELGKEHELPSIHLPLSRESAGETLGLVTCPGSSPSGAGLHSQMPTGEAGNKHEWRLGVAAQGATQSVFCFPILVELGDQKTAEPVMIMKGHWHSRPETMRSGED